MADNKVVRFDISVYVFSFVDVLNPFYHLVSYHQCSLQIKSFAAHIEQVL